MRFKPIVMGVITALALVVAPLGAWAAMTSNWQTPSHITALVDTGGPAPSTLITPPSGMLAKTETISCSTNGQWVKISPYETIGYNVICLVGVSILGGREWLDTGGAILVYYGMSAAQVLGRASLKEVQPFGMTLATAFVQASLISHAPPYEAVPVPVLRL